MSPAQRPWILHVEDDPRSRLLIRSLLVADGWGYDGVNNGREALARLQRLPHPRVILMDLDMPVMDGVRATSLIKADPTLQAIPVIIVTGNDDDGDRQRAQEAGADAYLLKPLRRAALLEALTEVGASPPGEASPPPLETPGACLARLQACLAELIEAGGEGEDRIRGAAEAAGRLRELLEAPPEPNP